MMGTVNHENKGKADTMHHVRFSGVVHLATDRGTEVPKPLCAPEPPMSRLERRAADRIAARGDNVTQAARTELPVDCPGCIEVIEDIQREMIEREVVNDV